MALQERSIGYSEILKIRGGEGRGEVLRSRPKAGEKNHQCLSALEPGYRCGGVSWVIAGELESLDRFQLMERCRMLVGIFEKVALCEFGILRFETVETRGKYHERLLYDHRNSFQKREIEEY